MLSPAHIQARIAAAELYHQTVARFIRERSFQELHSNWHELSVIEMHAAVNPHLYEEFVPLERVLGPRIFTADITRTFSSCMSDFLWGYPCPFKGRTLQADHAFPYALGGPTDPTNLLVFCDLHNQAKGHDIHLYPRWESPPTWLKDTADRIIRILNQIEFQRP